MGMGPLSVGGCGCGSTYVNVGLSTCMGGVPAGLAFTITCGGSVVYSGTTETNSAPVPVGLLTTGCTIAIAGYGSPRWASPTTIVLISGMVYSAFFGPADGYVCCGTCPFPISNRLIFTTTIEVLTSGSYVPTVVNLLLSFTTVLEAGGAGQAGGPGYSDPLTLPFYALSCNFTILWISGFGEGDDQLLDVTVDCDPAVANVWYLTWTVGEFHIPYSATLTETTPVP